jgi:hypothetical protein
MDEIEEGELESDKIILEENNIDKSDVESGEITDDSNNYDNEDVSLLIIYLKYLFIYFYFFK